MNYTFYLNKKCNWSCEYCNQGCNRKELSDDELLYKFKFYLEESKKVFPKISKLSISGGELGLWSTYLWEGLKEIINKENVPVQVFTNGTLFSHPSFIKNTNYNWQFTWHCIPNINPDIKIEIPFKEDSLYNLKGNTEAMIVLTKKEIPYLDSFLKNNKHLNKIKIDIVQPSFYTSKDDSFSFTKEDYDKVYFTCLRNENVVYNYAIKSLDSLRSRLKSGGIESIQNICSKNNNLLLLDITDDIIYRCCDYTDKAELNLENLILHSKNELFKNHNCGNCVSQIIHYFNYINQ